MCGIAGILNGPGDVDAMVETIGHRGPDQVGSWGNGRISLGACRLRVLDLQAGDQPLRINGTAIVYNGEVFNFHRIRRELEEEFGIEFETRTDTEVVLRAYEAWGPRCVERFVGQWAFAIWDGEKLFLSRDRMGEKPLYYAWDEGRFVFASEIKAVVREIRTEPVISDLWRAFETPGPGRTMFADIRELEAGCNMTVVPVQGAEIERYWTVPEVRETNRTDDDLAEELRFLVRQAVLDRLVADVPVGIALSGGIDSAAVACIAKPEYAFTCRFDLGPDYDEHAWSEKTAQAAGCRQVVVSPTADDMRERLEDIVWHLDQPVATASPIGDFAICREAADRGVKVLLGGQGSDEAFGGYTRHLVLHLDQMLAGCPELASYHGLCRKVWGERALGSSPAAVYERLIRRGKGSVGTSTIQEAFDGRTPLAGACRADLALTLPALIRMNDRSSAAAGIENRSPFLDHRLIEFGARLPDRFKIREMRTKWLLRKALRGIVPDVVLDRRDKKGLVVPFVPWLSGPLREWAAELCTALWSRGLGFDVRTEDATGFDRSVYMAVTVELWLRRMFG